jgi:CHASE2 domain-containing sensor protein
MQGTAFVVRAAALLDTRPLDAGLFTDRIVLVGATHLATSDHWLTPAGVLPGVELLAQSVRFWPLQAQRAGGGPAALGVRIGAVLLFAAFALLDWYLRPLFALLGAALLALLLAAIAINGFGGYAVFDVIEGAVLLAVLYKLLRMSWEFVAGFLASHRGRGPDGRARATFKALLLRDELGAVEDD